MDINFDCERIEIKPNGYRAVEVNIEGVDTTDLLINIPVDEVVAYYDADKLLDEIGIDEAKKHFGLIETGEE